jgi:hypothetical protein
MYHCPNGGSRNPIEAARLKAQGVKPGVADVFLPVKRGAFSGLYIELKKPSQRPKRGGAGGVTAEQTEFGAFVLAQGFGWCVCYDWEEAARVVTEYLQS